MRKDQFNKSLKCGAVLTYLSGYPDLIEKEASLATGYGKLSDLMSRIEKASAKQTSVHKGKTETKRSSQLTLRRSVNHVRLHLFAYACSAGREETKAIAGISDTSFSQLRDTEQQTQAKLILAEARKYLPELQARGITEETLNALDDAIKSFSAALNIRNSCVGERISAGSELKNLFSEVAILFSVEMKAAMETFRTSHPEFYKGYTAVCHTRALGKRSKKAAAKDAPESAETKTDAPASVEDAPDAVKDASASVNGTPALVKDSSTPVTGAPTPSNGKSTPVNGTSKPGKDTSTPVKEMSSPEQDATVPGNDAPAVVPEAAAG
jgi:hypothetical protein